MSTSRGHSRGSGAGPRNRLSWRPPATRMRAALVPRPVRERVREERQQGESGERSNDPVMIRCTARGQRVTGDAVGRPCGRARALHPRDTARRHRGATGSATVRRPRRSPANGAVTIIAADQTRTGRCARGRLHGVHKGRSICRPAKPARHGADLDRDGRRGRNHGVARVDAARAADRHSSPRGAAFRTSPRRRLDRAISWWRTARARRDQPGRSWPPIASSSHAGGRGSAIPRRGTSSRRHAAAACTRPASRGPASKWR